ncbi:uncharacterized protein LOC142977675 [Anticarsia gemmatalis]|uniref:uncharacterized protein LOC142977675 n=1 Tax=Anticarsia gemmatalis TaxID=129554 RepID=UPI003F76C960
MADNLPLIPGKGAVCTDVRPVLRTVFRELDYLPPLTIDGSSEETKTAGDGDHTAPSAEPWIDQYKSECEEIWDHEGEIKHQHARRIARQPLPNIFKLHHQREDKEVPQWRLQRGLIDRKDLVPNIEQDAGRDTSLWMKNILNVSSGDVTSEKITSPCRCHQQPVVLRSPHEDSWQTLSIGQVLPHPPHVTPSAPPPPAQHDYIICVPPQLDFVNFVMGHMHAKTIRLVNVSKFECRLSITPPKRLEFDIELQGPRGMTVTSGAAAELKVKFKASDVRALYDVITVRVNCGQTFVVPIAAYMQPPLLDIMIPSMNSLLLCTTEPEGPASQLAVGCDVIELGSRLLGDVHCARVLLHCDARHADFFVLTEDSWLDWSLDCLTTRGSVVSSPFVLWPAWWRGGGAVRACAWCVAERAGVHVTALRLLSSTAITRHLHLLADVLYFQPHHLTIEAHDKDYDICSDEDPACEYYVNLGTAFPHRSLSITVHLVNHSPVVYSYYWSVRPWGVCSCWEEERVSEGSFGGEDDSERLCVGAKEAKHLSEEDPAAYAKRSDNARLVRVEPGRSQIMPRSTCALHVHVPDVGGELGVQRAVLMLILRNIPKDSFSPDYEPMIINTEVVANDPIPGLKVGSREVCEVVCAQMEVWWEVVPLRFVLDPPVLMLYHSRRATSIEVNISAWQLYGWDESRVVWVTPERVPRPAPLYLTPAHCATTTVTLPLPSLPNHYPQTDELRMLADTNEWEANCVITRQCETRHPTLRPVRAWLGVVPPGMHMQTTFELTNDTFQHICFWCEPYRWIGENKPRPACVGRIPCENCKEVACSCALLRPSRGALKEGEVADIRYDVNAPQRDGCVATLVQARRCGADLARVHGAAATEARASLVAYRVLAPRVIVRLLPCFGISHECYTGCGLDPGALGSQLGTATLRPSGALILGRRSCYRLRITNITPLPTAVHFETPIDGTEFLKVKFTPNDFSVRSYAEVEVRVVLDARKVCPRRVFVYRASLLRAHMPIYVIVDAAIAGVEISCQVPIGGDVDTNEFVIMRRTQREGPREEEERTSPTSQEIFALEDRKRELVQENICRCRYKMVYIPPEKRPQPPPPEDEYLPIEILTRPPSLTRVCPCRSCHKPSMPDAPESISLQFINIPLRKVCERRLVLRNESVVTARWSTAVRRWPRKECKTLDTDAVSCGVAAPGVALWCAPARGVLAARAHVDLRLLVYADCWGLYRDEILIQVEDVEPIVLQVWVQAVGAPLHVKLLPQAAAAPPALLAPLAPPTVWLTSSDARRTLRVCNTSRCELAVHAYLTLTHERAQDALPFRVYLRLFDVPPRACPCLTAFDSEEQLAESSESSAARDDMDTGVDLYLAPDLGPQDDTYYKVSPEVCSVAAGECAQWSVSLEAPPHAERAPDAALLLRLLPAERDRAGDMWYRDEPAPQPVRVRHAAREPLLKLSTDEVRVHICALDLPCGDYLRVRKRFRVQNVGNGRAAVCALTLAPWCVLQEAAACAPGCSCVPRARRDLQLDLDLPPRSSTEMCVEVCVSTLEAWPAGAGAACSPPPYEPRRRATTALSFYHQQLLLTTLPLTLDIEYPVIRAEPALVDFGFVTDGDSRKTYISVSHTSRTATLQLAAQWVGCAEFELWPPFLEVAAGASARLYLQYTAVWRRGPAEGCVNISVCSGAGAEPRLAGGVRAGWCRAAVAARAAPSRDHKCRAAAHDHTDDHHLLPPRAAAYRP